MYTIVRPASLNQKDETSKLDHRPDQERALFGREECAQVADDAVVVEQRVVDVEQEDEVVHVSAPLRRRVARDA